MDDLKLEMDLLNRSLLNALAEASIIKGIKVNYNVFPVLARLNELIIGKNNERQLHLIFQQALEDI